MSTELIDENMIHLLPDLINKWSLLFEKIVKFRVSVYNVRQQPGHYTMENDRLWVRVNTRNIRI